MSVQWLGKLNTSYPRGEQYDVKPRFLSRAVSYNTDEESKSHYRKAGTSAAAEKQLPPHKSRRY